MMNKKHKNKELDPELSPETGPDQKVPDEAPGEIVREADQEAAAGSLAREIEKLALELEQRMKEAEEASDKYRRTYADFENYRKRMQRDQTEFRKYANEQMALELLPVVDHLSLALRHANEGGPCGDALLQGVEMVCKQFRDVLEKFGIKPFKSEGEPFDPALHEAMMQVETSDAPENMVVQVFQDGYLYHEKVLRHAKVGVSKKPGTSEGENRAAREEAAKDDE